MCAYIAHANVVVSRSADRRAGLPTVSRSARHAGMSVGRTSRSVHVHVCEVARVCHIDSVSVNMQACGNMQSSTVYSSHVRMYIIDMAFVAISPSTRDALGGLIAWGSLVFEHTRACSCGMFCRCSALSSGCTKTFSTCQV